jgi:hypothetical protein
VQHFGSTDIDRRAVAGTLIRFTDQSEENHGIPTTDAGTTIPDFGLFESRLEPAEHGAKDPLLQLERQSKAMP